MGVGTKNYLFRERSICNLEGKNIYLAANGAVDGGEPSARARAFAPGVKKVCVMPSTTSSVSFIARSPYKNMGVNHRQHHQSIQQTERDLVFQRTPFSLLTQNMRRSAHSPVFFNLKPSVCLAISAKQTLETVYPPPSSRVFVVAPVFATILDDATTTG